MCDFEGQWAGRTLLEDAMVCGNEGKREKREGPEWVRVPTGTMGE